MADAAKRLKVTARGQVTLRKSTLRHLGIRPGDQIEVESLPAGRVILRAARPVGSIEDFIGVLAGETDKAATVEEIAEAAASGWAGES